jgi:hypothetical protein
MRYDFDAWRNKNGSMYTYILRRLSFYCYCCCSKEHFHCC